MLNLGKGDSQLVDDIIKLVYEAKQAVASTVNSATTVLYWNLGKRINDEFLQNKRAGYGKNIIGVISQKLTEEYGKGWSEKQIRHCLRFAETFNDQEKVYALSRQLSWTHFRILTYVKNELSRLFYIEMCLIRNNFV